MQNKIESVLLIEDLGINIPLSDSDDLMRREEVY